MIDRKTYWKREVYSALVEYAAEKGIQAFALQADDITAEVPPSPQMGDLGFPMFAYAKIFRMNPVQLASMVSEKVSQKLLQEADTDAQDKVQAVGPYVNVYFDRKQVVAEVLKRSGNEDWNDTKPLSGKRIMVEFSCPNTNKPLHLGHLRNNVLGESLSRILKEAGAEVRKVNLINDRGVHICKSMLAYKVYGQSRTPEDEGL
ncbi:MAG TPA: arginine--tRNA ligase, partial [Spirochaetales bacterium]|nr:arginine--tRNA ligase [Spirochaetales bacterium]HPS15055.1 arginine--tRNA ligase [Spirochaetales bacterium]